MRICSCLFVAITFLLPLGYLLGQGKGDLDLVQGGWQVISIESDGKPSFLLEIYEKSELTIIKKIFDVRIPGAQQKVKERFGITFEIDTTAQPKWVDVTVFENGSEKNYKGIFSLEGDKLTVCIGVGPNHRRPIDFTAREGSMRMLGVLVRKAKGADNSVNRDTAAPQPEIMK